MFPWTLETLHNRFSFSRMYNWMASNSRESTQDSTCSLAPCWLCVGRPEQGEGPRRKGVTLACHQTEHGRCRQACTRRQHSNEGSQGACSPIPLGEGSGGRGRNGTFEPGGPVCHSEQLPGCLTAPGLPPAPGWCHRASHSTGQNSHSTAAPQ